MRPALPPLRVAMLSSHRAPALPFLLDEDPARGRQWELVAFLTTTPPCADAGRARAAGVSVLVNDIRDFYRGRGARLTDLRHRPDFDRMTAALLEPFRPDLVVLCGYLHILTAPMLDLYRDRLVNVHDGDLTVLDADGRPRWRGLRSTRDAMLAGARETRSVVHLVTEEVDVGPVLLRSGPFPVRQTSASAQRDWMMRAAWGPLLARTIYLFARPTRPARPALSGD